jgi:hypothetical protein
VSALGELQAGRAGGDFVLELQRTIRAVAVSRNFPPPEGHTRWDADAVWSVASEFMGDAQTPRRLTDLAVHCATGDALRARLQGTVRNFLADLGRRTPIGKLVVRINDVLRGEAGFVLVAGRWARADGREEAGADDPDALARALAGQVVVVPAWGHDAHRAAPVADRATIVALCGALLDASGGSLTPRALARAIGRRLGLGQAPLSLDVSAFDGPAASGGSGGSGPSGPSGLSDGTANEALRLRRAGEVVARLNDRERLAVAYPEYTVRQLAPVLGVSPSQCHVIRGRAVEIIRIEVIDDDDAEGVALLVMELARSVAGLVDSGRGSAVVVAR